MGLASQKLTAKRTVISNGRGIPKGMGRGGGGIKLWNFRRQGGIKYGSRPW